MKKWKTNFFFWGGGRGVRGIVSNPLSETLFSLNQVYSMIPSIKSSEYLNQMAAGENGVSCKKRQRKREQCINRVRGGALEGFRNGVGWKWPLRKRTPDHFK